MSDIISLLPDSIANQIAAGEVVQRPSSVVKELMENSVDAEATHINVIVKEAGKGLLQIVDDGKGMSETDARMSLERHATSKIKKAEDLFHLHTMGFRGEALASIAAVAQMEIKTKLSGADLGTNLVVEGSVVKTHEPAACNPGTSISVKNLFYNIPARRNFLKSNPVETKHIIDEFQRLALANPQIAFSLHQNDQETYNLPVANLGQRIVHLFGKNYSEQLAPCSEETDDIKISGYIGKPEFARKTRGEQFFFVNNRFIKSGYLSHAVKIAFEGLVPMNTYPFYVLFIEMNTERIDVNVHPTKTEIKFDDERLVYGVVRAAVKRALGVHNITPSIDFDQDVNFARDTRNLRPTSSENDYSQFKSAGPSNLDHWENLMPSSLNLEAQPEQEHLTFQSAANSFETDAVLPDQGTTQKSYQLHASYIITQVKSGMIMVDQHAAHERILYERFLTYLEHSPGSSQQNLFPETVELNPADFSLVMELKDEITALGFLFEVFGKNSLVINGIPPEVSGSNEKKMFEGLIEQFKQNQKNLSVSKSENLARSMAARAAMKQGIQMNENERSGLIDELFACKNPNYAPNGQLTFFILDLNKIQSFFN